MKILAVIPHVCKPWPGGSLGELQANEKTLGEVNSVPEECLPKFSCVYITCANNRISVPVPLVLLHCHSNTLCSEGAGLSSLSGSVLETQDHLLECLIHKYSANSCYIHVVENLYMNLHSSRRIKVNNLVNS